MKAFILIAALGLFFASENAVAQDCCEALRKEVKEAPQYPNIAELGRRGDRTDIQLLKPILQKNLHPLVRSQTLRALAKLGDIMSFLNVAAGCYEHDGMRQDNCFVGLKYIGGSESIRVLNERLNDTLRPQSDADTGFNSPARYAMKVLMEIVPDAPKLDIDLYEDGPRLAWRSYLSKHPSLMAPSENFDWAQILRECVSKEDERAVLMVGRLANSTLIPDARAQLAVLEASTAGKAPPIQRALGLLLARLGDPAEFSKIVARLSDSDPYRQDEAVHQLVYVRGPRAIRVLGQLLDRSEPRKPLATSSAADSEPDGAAGPRPLNMVAMLGLAHLIPGYDLSVTPFEFLRSAQAAEWKRRVRIYEQKEGK